MRTLTNPETFVTAWAIHDRTWSSLSFLFSVKRLLSLFLKGPCWMKDSKTMNEKAAAGQGLLARKADQNKQQILSKRSCPHQCQTQQPNMATLFRLYRASVGACLACATLSSYEPSLKTTHPFYHLRAHAWLSQDKKLFIKLTLSFPTPQSAPKMSVRGAGGAPAL